MNTFLRSVKLASRERRLTYLSVFLAVTQTALEAITPQIIKRLLDLVQSIGIRAEVIALPREFWAYLVAFAVLVYVIDSVMQTKNFTIVKWWNRTRKRVSGMLLEHLQKLPFRYYEFNSAGEVKEKIDQGVMALNRILQGTFMDIIPQVLYISIAIFFLFRVSYIFGLVVFLGIPLFVIISLIFTQRIIRTENESRDVEEVVSGIAVETILNIRTIRAFSSEEKHVGQYSSKLNDAEFLALKQMKYRTRMNVFRFMIVNTARIVILILGIYWALTGKITIGTFALAWAYTERSFSPMWHLTWVIDDIQKGLISVRRIFEILDTEPSPIDTKNALSLKNIKGKIEFRDINFGYEDRIILNGFDLTIEPGQVVALVGKSGSGKSTLIKLLLRFHEIHEGEILIDGYRIKEITQKSLRQNIGAVLQETNLFNDTIYNNILYGKPGASKKEVIAAAKSAHAHEFIEKLSDGYETLVGGKGVRLSGGEMQRINIARAILKDAPILVLDEPTSALDSESEQLIQDALEKLLVKKTAIIIAHRLSTVAKSDLIVVMDRGKVVEKDTHEKLIKNGGIYAKLFDIQSGGYLS